jgi:CBS domain-containing protein
MLVGELMTRGVISVRADDRLAIARDSLRTNGVHHLLVMNGEHVEGVLSMRDLAGKADDTFVNDVMTRNVATIEAGASLRKAASLMIRGTTGCLPVTENGIVAGIITTTDLMKVLNAEMTLS